MGTCLYTAHILYKWKEERKGLSKIICWWIRMEPNWLFWLHLLFSTTACHCSIFCFSDMKSSNYFSVSSKWMQKSVFTLPKLVLFASAFPGKRFPKFESLSLSSNLIWNPSNELSEYQHQNPNQKCASSLCMRILMICNQAAADACN